MTTIAANLKCMAADSRGALGGGVFYQADKIRKVKKMIVGACGNGSDCNRFLEWASRDFKEPTPRWKEKLNDNDSIVGLVLKPDGLYLYVPSDPEPEKINSPCFAIGTGGQAAIVAMRLGKTPAEAIEAVFEVDYFTGPPILEIEL